MIVIEDIHQAVVDHHIDDLVVEHSGAPSAGRDRISGRGHVLSTAGQYDINVAGLDHLRRQRNGSQAGTADFIQSKARNFHRNTGIQGDLTCNVLPQAALQDAAHDHFFDHVRLDARSFDRCLRCDRTECSCRYILQGAAEAADGGSRCAYDYYFSHK